MTRRPTPTRPKVSGGSALVLLGLLAGCSGGEEERTITVLAAASLTEPFEDLAQEFEEEHPGVRVELAFDSSATLAQQAVEGAPADLLATADEVTMDAASEVLTGEAQVFATNTMVLVTPAANPSGIAGVDDLREGDATYVVCVETAPCGKVAQELLAANGVTAAPASLEVDVKAVLARVTSDEADAGLVYASDATAAGDQVERFDVPGAEETPTTYPIATLHQTTEATLAGQFVDLVLSGDGRRVLTDAGFGPP